MDLRVYCDGGARGNPGPAAAGFVVFEDPPSLGGFGEAKAGILREKRGKYLGKSTNNVAEYSAVIEALSYLRDLGNLSSISETRFFLDSSLVVNQLNGKFKVKDGKLRELLVKIRELEQQLSPTRLSFAYIPREKNSLADQVVNETLDRNA